MTARPLRRPLPGRLPWRLRPAAPLMLLVRLWQAVLRPVAGPNCRFTPSCSDYALEALRRHGALRGSRLAAWRVLRCNPWSAGGFDPVPPAPRPDPKVRTP